MNPESAGDGWKRPVQIRKQELDVKSSTEEAATEARLIRRQMDREYWNKWWKMMDIETQGTYMARVKYYVWKGLDAPVTWFRENVSEPVQDKYGHWPYYQRKFSRVPSIDECSLLDMSCIYEANKQYERDKVVDHNILSILLKRIDHCLIFNHQNWAACAQVVEDFEENELNFFIKYGELGARCDAQDVYMKQKHRMIWERRHPEIMEERARLYQEHKKKLAEGIFDRDFWRPGMYYSDKTKLTPPYDQHEGRLIPPSDLPRYHDWEYYKKIKEDPNFDPDKGVTGDPAVLHPFKGWKFFWFGRENKKETEK